MLDIFNDDTFLCMFYAILIQILFDCCLKIGYMDLYIIIQNMFRSAVDHRILCILGSCTFPLVFDDIGDPIVDNIFLNFVFYLHGVHNVIDM